MCTFVCVCVCVCIIHRYPVALNCKHIYNWSTLTTRRSNGEFSLTTCART